MLKFVCLKKYQVLMTNNEFLNRLSSDTGEFYQNTYLQNLYILIISILTEVLRTLLKQIRDVNKKFKIKPSESSSLLAFFAKLLFLSSSNFLFFPFSFCFFLLFSSFEDSPEASPSCFFSLCEVESSSNFSSSEQSFFACFPSFHWHFAFFRIITVIA